MEGALIVANNEKLCRAHSDTLEAHMPAFLPLGSCKFFPFIIIILILNKFCFAVPHYRFLHIYPLLGLYFPPVVSSFLSATVFSPSLVTPVMLDIASQLIAALNDFKFFFFAVINKIQDLEYARQLLYY